ncbi:MAG: hypothetical protein HY906_21015, partial [Deltaproteobacteria bacterium]|nr:hypothetical protein [Deltaproteobacteria bacterium]
MRLHLLALPLVSAALGACGPVFPVPFTAGQLAADSSGPALVHFLGQPDASPAVCDLQNRGPHLAGFTDAIGRDLADGLADAKIPPELFRRCVDALMKHLTPPQGAELLAALGRSYRQLLRDGAIETNRARQAQLEALHRIYLERHARLAPPARLVTEWVTELQAALTRKRLGPYATRQAEDLLATVQLERGSWLGRPVDERMLDQLHAKGDEATLKRFVARLPDVAQRMQAGRRLIRLRIAASPFKELRENAAAVEETVMRQGRNPVVPATHTPLGGELLPDRIPVRGVLVRQNVLEQSISLFGYSGDRPGVSVLPELRLRGALQIRLRGVSLPVTLCGPPRELDPTPCVLASEVKLRNPTAYLDEDGAFHFNEHVTTQHALLLAQGGADFHLPITLAGKVLVDLRWPLWFERPADLVFVGQVPGATGPNLVVGADNRFPPRVIYSVAAGGITYVVVVESADAAGFHVDSRGSPGYPGEPGNPGHAGARGVDGTGASCPSSPGTSGGAGGSGGPG